MTPRHPWTPEELAQARALRSSGIAYATIADRLGRTPEAVKMRLRSPEPNGRKLPDYTGPQQIAKLPRLRPGHRARVLNCGRCDTGCLCGYEGVVKAVVGSITAEGPRAPVTWRVWFEGREGWVEAARVEWVR